MKPSTFALFLAGAVLAGCGGMKKKNADARPASANPQVLLLGEVHDNPQGHKLRYEELRKRVEAGWRPAIAMEQFDRDQQDLLNDAQKGCVDAACVIRLMKKPGWDWQQYYGIIQLALDHQLPLIAVNLSRAEASKTVRDGLASGFDEKTRAAYRLNEPVSADFRKAQENEIREGHCNMLPDMMLPGMVDAQMARDVWMAKLIRDQQPRDVVLIAGNGHVRKDLGVPYWLNAVQPALTVRSIGYLEPKGKGKYDEVREIPAAKREDPCGKFRK
ncbi:ChaN family lipoprotein [Massilia endophytica]|uniref:ChaN family lipoprotein n=1 Tax=Massilia endophytica TaxID=2899220 RepID=UPI001E4E8501|nr:ChaN family lipoprotein [Massilia endophytica]UGQ45589.1 ChaN family lipoprotein [Massilia endophytica]